MRVSPHHQENRIDHTVSKLVNDLIVPIGWTTVSDYRLSGDPGKDFLVALHRLGWSHKALLGDVFRYPGYGPGLLDIKNLSMVDVKNAILNQDARCCISLGEPDNTRHEYFLNMQRVFWLNQIPYTVAIDIIKDAAVSWGEIWSTVSLKCETAMYYTCGPLKGRIANLNVIRNTLTLHTLFDPSHNPWCQCYHSLYDQLAGNLSTFGVLRRGDLYPGYQPVCLKWWVEDCLRKITTTTRDRGCQVMGELHRLQKSICIVSQVGITGPPLREPSQATNITPDTDHSTYNTEHPCFIRKLYTTVKSTRPTNIDLFIKQVVECVMGLPTLEYTFVCNFPNQTTCIVGQEQANSMRNYIEAVREAYKTYLSTSTNSTQTSAGDNILEMINHIFTSNMDYLKYKTRIQCVTSLVLLSIVQGYIMTSTITEY